MFHRYQPVGVLAPFVEMIWFASRGPLAHTREISLPSGRTDLVIPLEQESIVRFDHPGSTDARHYRGAIVQGPHDRFLVRGMGGASSVIGVHFRAGGAAACFGGDLPDLRNRTVLLEDLWGVPAADLRNQLLDTDSVAAKVGVLVEHLSRRISIDHGRDAAIWRSLQVLQDNFASSSIGSLQQQAGCSAARFIRRFTDVVGLTPKRYARVARFNALLRKVNRDGNPDWAALAAECGYYDQSHLVREFRTLAGMTPSQYRPLGVNQPTHVPILSGG